MNRFLGGPDQSIERRIPPAWPTLTENLERVTSEATLADVTRHAGILGKRAREIEGRALDAPQDE